MPLHRLRKIFVLLSLSLVFSTSSGLMADSNNAELSLGFADIAPYSFRDKDGRAKGINIDLIRAAYAAMGVKIKVTFLPYGRVLQFIRNGTVDGGLTAYDLIEDPELKKGLYAPVYFSKYYSCLIYMKERFPDGLGIKSVGDLKKAKGLSVDVKRATPEAKLLRDAGLSVYEQEDSLGMIKRFIVGRTDLAYGTPVLAVHMLREVNFPPGKVGFDIYRSGPMYLTMSKAKKSYQDNFFIFAEGLLGIIKDGTYLKIAEQYHGKGSRYAAMHPAADKVLDFLNSARKKQKDQSTGPIRDSRKQ